MKCNLKGLGLEKHQKREMERGGEGKQGCRGPREVKPNHGAQPRKALGRWDVRIGVCQKELGCGECSTEVLRLG